MEDAFAPEIKAPTTRSLVPMVVDAELPLTVMMFVVFVMATVPEEYICAPRFKIRALFPERFTGPTLFVPESRELVNEAEFVPDACKVKVPKPE